MAKEEYDNFTPLPYPTRPLEVRGSIILEYIIPDEDKEKVLRKLWFYAEPPPSLNATRFDLLAEKHFKVRDFRVMREGCTNVLASPYYVESGGTVIDWAPASWGRSPKS